MRSCRISLKLSEPTEAQSQVNCVTILFFIAILTNEKGHKIMTYLQNILMTLCLLRKELVIVAGMEIAK